MSIKDMSDEEFAEYLVRVEGDHYASGSTATADDYREAAKRIRRLLKTVADIVKCIKEE